MIHTVLHRKLKIEQYKPSKAGLNSWSGAPNGSVVPASLMAPVVLLLKTGTWCTGCNKEIVLDTSICKWYKLLEPLQNKGE